MAGRHPVATLTIVIAGAFGVGFAASAYLNYVQFQRAQDDQRQLQGTITDLRYQLAQDSQASPSPSASVTPSPSPSPTQTPPPVLGAQALPLPQLGITLTATDPLTDLTFSYQLISGLAVANLTTTSLIPGGSKCGPGALGQLVRRPLSSRASSASVFIKRLGNYNFYYVSPTFTCPLAATTTDRAAIMGVLSTLH